jgi:hypothetical protein
VQPVDVLEADDVLGDVGERLGGVGVVARKIGVGMSKMWSDCTFLVRGTL